jgi:hypothetical protein
MKLDKNSLILVAVIVAVYAFFAGIYGRGEYELHEAEAGKIPVTITCAPDHNVLDFDCDAIANDIDVCPDMV